MVDGKMCVLAITSNADIYAKRESMDAVKMSEGKAALCHVARNRAIDSKSFEVISA
jgi:hypothetical protein